MNDISYEHLVEKALLHVVHDALEITANEGLTGENHFYITFQTQHPDVALSSRLKASYPDEITIVIQHEFSGLEVTDTGFAVTLSFGNIPERIVVPFCAVMRFADPHAQFALSFNPPPPQKAKAQKAEKAEVSETKQADQDETANVVSLSAFRKKK